MVAAASSLGWNSVLLAQPVCSVRTLIAARSRVFAEYCEGMLADRVSVSVVYLLAEVEVPQMMNGIRTLFMFVVAAILATLVSGCARCDEKCIDRHDECRERAGNDFDDLVNCGSDYNVCLRGCGQG